MRIDLVGQVFGRLTVQRFVESVPPRYEAIWHCQCICGNVKDVKATNLRNGKTQSCGCLHREQLATRNKTNATHGMWTEYYEGKSSSALNRWYHHGMSHERYLELANAQQFKCAICTREAKLFVDHDHKHCSGRKSCVECQRGLICVGCNTGLGAFADNVEALRKAADYLERFNDKSTFGGGRSSERPRAHKSF